MKTKVLFLSAALCCGVMNAWAQPTTSAPVPPEYATNRVVSIYSDAYDNPVGWNFGVWDSGTAYAEETIADTQDHVAKFTTTDLGYFGWELQRDVNALTMTHLHVDVWSDAAFEFRLAPICRTQPTGEQPQTVQVKAGEWTQIELTVQSYTDLGLDMSGVYQLKFDQIGARTFYVDNVYFYNNSTATDTEAPSKPEVSVASASYFHVVLSCTATDNSGSVTYNVTADGGITATGGGVSGMAAQVTVSGLQAGTEYTFTVTASDLDGNNSEATTVTATTLTAPAPAEAPAHDAANVFSIYSNAYTAGTWFNIGNWNQSTVPTEVTLVEGDKVYLLENYNHMGWEMNGNQSIGDLSGMEYLHVDVYPVTEGASFTITPIWGATQRMDYTCTPFTAGQWNSYDIPLTAFTGIDLAAIYQMAFGGGTGGSLFIDNVYFWKEGKGPSTLSAQPEALKADVTVAGGQLRVQAAEVSHIRVYNLMGACVAEAEASELHTALPAGAYVVTVNGQARKVALQ